ncbi:xylulokinase [Cnuella takakiae]|uniref:Xylulokinase n=1 Tax=Cnuella takakiae TaxID=1302690 RepID=A0A1M5B6X0_9BACT|nr:FGGY family carbohydrate kinase [Cnuella takakiae]OLY93357.1 carbohydrate kinase [Cnuella takakiae]SHF38198.1 xylulokinase [Cnuella takakiae]
MLLLGIDLGTSSIKVSVVDADTGHVVAQAQYPEQETGIKVVQPGWAEQSPEEWWQNVQGAIRKAVTSNSFNAQDISAIGIAYQMHGLVTVDKTGRSLRDAIIWCDGRAIPYGDKAFQAIGPERSLSRLLNSPGNFTAAKLAWVKDAEPEVFKQVDKVMLPGDYIALKLTGKATTSASALSEGIFWDFQDEQISADVLNYFGYDAAIIPEVQPVFSEHGQVSAAVAAQLGLRAGIPVSYKAGDQPNNALSLNVLQPGEVAATAGTSGVIYGVSDELTYDQQSRINSFAHVNHSAANKRVGVLLCINGTGILNRWLRDTVAPGVSYAQLNEEASKVAAGSNGLFILPFGNGAERMLGNKMVGAHIHCLDLNIHTRAHLVRAGQEGIAFAFRYGLDIMRENGMHPSVIRAGKANMFLSPLFTEAFVNVTGVPVELYPCDGSVGAALGAGIGAGIYQNENDAFRNIKPLELIAPGAQQERYEELYQQWKKLLLQHL